MLTRLMFKFGKKWGIGWMISWTLFYLYFFNKNILRSCSHRLDSLHESDKLIEGGDVCQFEIPTFCSHQSVQGVYWPLWLKGRNCENFEDDFTLHKSRCPNTKIVAYPVLNDFDYCTKYNSKRTYDEIKKELKEVSEEEMLKTSKYHTFIDFRKKKEGEVVINIKNQIERNPKIKERVKDIDENHVNFLSILVDTVSRNHFLRSYPQTTAFLKEHHHSLNKEFRVYEFFRTHSIKGYSYPNYLASTYGRLEEILDEPTHQTRVDTLMKKAGYITGLSSDFCAYPELETETDRSCDNYSDDEDPDHIFFSLSCDANNRMEVDPYDLSLGNGPFQIGRKCFVKKDQTHYSYKYAHEFFKTYRGKRKFFTARLVTNHEITGQNNRFSESESLEFFKKMKADGFLKNTIVMFYSDHGDHITPLKATQSGVTERFNPFFYMMIPDSLKGKYDKQLKVNQHRLVTHFDFFRTWSKAAGTKMEDYHSNVKLGYSLLDDEIPENRTCKDAFVQGRCVCLMKDEMAQLKLERLMQKK